MYYFIIFIELLQYFYNKVFTCFNLHISIVFSILTKILKELSLSD